MPEATWVSELQVTDTERQVLVRAQTAGDLDPGELWGAIEIATGLYDEAKRTGQLLKPIIGRLLIALRSHPGLYQTRGFTTYDDFLTRGCRELFNLPRSEAYRIIRLVETFPTLAPAEFAEIGEGKLYTLSSFTNSNDPACIGWLDLAKNSTLDQLKDRIVQQGEHTAEGLVPVQISLSTNLEVKRAWLAFVDDPRVQSTVGSADHGQILSAAILEAASSWGI